MEVKEQKTFTFKTNINCGGCIAKVTPDMDKAENLKSWSVETGNPNKVLTVVSNGITKQEIIDLVKSNGFDIEVIDF
ncbi:heavy-metal-associated domain-containing protein [Dysgonomonas sp. ZJ709]|uniref:heavy-metal-associated domain-containing protein n=1 Tax=Dysgonomonas sp. ZJ709 TaxID=2709797 RepID=UPI0013EAC44B|nr:hypothetical protein [Dysgonomonas sp. ZJ709]